MKNEDDGFLIFLLIFIFEIILHISSRIFYKLQFRSLFQKPAYIKSQNPNNDKLMKLLSENKSTEEIAEQIPNYPWCLVNNDVFELTNYLHPGGNFLIQKTIGKELGRYLYGGFCLEGLNMKSHKHTIYSIDYLHNRYVGSLEEHLPSIISGGDGSLTKLWQLKDKIKLSNTTSLFLFENEGSKVKNYVPGVTWIGRHFTITAKNGNPRTRLYTTILSYTEGNQQYRKYLMDSYDSIKTGKALPKLDNYKVSDETNKLPFVIKRYPFSKGFSRFIHDSNHPEYQITGPIGRGMELRNDLGGTFYLFAGGTGILPFLDLIDLVLKKAIFTVSKRNSAKIENPFGEDYENSFASSIKVVLFGAFSTPDDFTGSEFVAKLHKISEEENLALFEATVRMDKNPGDFLGIPKTTGYFDEEFIKRNVDLQRQSRFYVCGSPAMNTMVLGALTRLGVPDSRVYIV